MEAFWTGFDKAGSRGTIKAYEWLQGLRGAVSGGMTGAGAGLLARSRFEEKFKEDHEKNLGDALIAKAPLLGVMSGVIGGALLGRRFAEKQTKPIKDAMRQFESFKDSLSGFSKQSSLVDSFLEKRAGLKSEVSLKDHQRRAIAQLQKNDGSLLVAHATGSGKTLTGIAGFEDLRRTGKAKRSLVVVPAALRENFVENIRRFTDSDLAVYGPKGERSSKNIGETSSADYNIVSYELFKEHGDELLKTTGADTLIMDEVHRARGTEGVTYNKIKDLRPRFKNAITLTGSIVNNEPNDVVPLMDITYTPQGHKLVSKKFFDKLFVSKDAKTRGLLKPKVEVVKGLVNKKQLSRYLEGKIDFVSHKDLEKDMPKKEVIDVPVPMSKEQKKLYDFTLSSVDPVTRWKIRNNMPVGQREAQDAFGKLNNARQVSTDHAVLDKKLTDVNPLEYSPKVQAVVRDLKSHLGEKPSNRSVIYGNLVKFQLDAVEKALKKEKIPYAKFMGLGQEGQTAKTRPEEIKDFQAGRKRVLLISGAGAEGLDLKNTSMMQMLEGHYNPEKIQQAEARIRRLGSMSHLPEEERKVIIKRYMAQPSETGVKNILSRALGAVGLAGGSQGVDKWMYNIADRKDRLNNEFRDVLRSDEKVAMLGNEVDSLFGEAYLEGVLGAAGRGLGDLPGQQAAKLVVKRRDADMEARMKQMLLDRGQEELTKKKHYNAILAESKLDERAIDASLGAGILVPGAVGLLSFNPTLKTKMRKPLQILGRAFGKGVTKLTKGRLGTGTGSFDQIIEMVMPTVIGGVAVGAVTPPLSEYAATKFQQHAIGNTKDLDIGIERYTEKLRRKAERKYKSSRGYVNEFETRKELGVDIAGI